MNSELFGLIFALSTVLLFGFIFGCIMYLIDTQAISGPEYGLIGVFSRDCITLISKTFDAVLSKYFHYKFKSEDDTIPTEV